MHVAAALAFALLAQSTAAADADAEVGAGSTRAASTPLPGPLDAPPAEDDTLVGGVSLGMAGGLMTIGAVAWWIDYDLVGFSLKETGFFQHWTYAGGADKMGHLFGHYLGVSAMTAIYEELGVPHERAVLFGVLFTSLIGQGVEVIDGFTEHGFEYGDVVMNLVGTALGAVSELDPRVERTFGMRMGYAPSPAYLENAREKRKGPLRTYLELVNDYSGQVVYADLKLGGALSLAGLDPGPARYVLAGVNWGTSGYQPKEAPSARQRNLGMHLGLAMPELLAHADLGGIAGGVLRGIATYYALPFVTVALVRDLEHERWFWSLGLANRL